MPIAAEVILVTQNEDIPGTSTLVYTCQSLEQANEVLADISFANLDEENCRAYRGILTDASTIPSKLLGCVPYLIVQLPSDDTQEDYVEAYFEKLPIIPSKIQERIQEILSQELEYTNDHGVDGNTLPDINDVFLFFGVQVPFTFNISEQEMDDEFEDRLGLLQSQLSIVNEVAQTLPKETVEGDSMSKKKVLLTITKNNGASFMIEGRLLGGCVTEEATKIAQNFEVAEKVHTSTTKKLSTVIRYLIGIETDNQKTDINLKTHGHLVVTLDAIKGEKDTVHAEVLSRQLYISPEIKLTPSYIDTTAGTKATFECADGTIIEIKEQIMKENANV
jgi:hypothetical protein